MFKVFNIEFLDFKLELLDEAFNTSTLNALDKV